MKIICHILCIRMQDIHNISRIHRRPLVFYIEGEAYDSYGSRGDWEA